MNKDEELLQLKARVAALEELLAVQEAAVLAQSERLEQSLRELQEKAAAMSHLNQQLQHEKSRLEGINQVMVDREMKMIELKREVDNLLLEVNRGKKYDV